MFADRAAVIPAWEQRGPEAARSSDPARRRGSAWAKSPQRPPYSSCAPDEGDDEANAAFRPAALVQPLGGGGEGAMPRLITDN